MAEVLIAALSPIGHVGPLLIVARDLADRGHRVTVMTGKAHTDAIHAAGARPHPLPALADVDDALFESSGQGRTTGIDALNQVIIQLFLAPMPHQVAELSTAMAHNRFDAIIADYGFFGIIPLLLRDPATRPPVLLYTSTPLLLSNRATAPNGTRPPPRSDVLGPLRDGGLDAFSQRVTLRTPQKATDAMIEALGSPHLPTFLLDIGILAERVVIPTVPSFEYPQGDLPANVRFVGAVHGPASPGITPPVWWPMLDGRRPVVHVTQGTVDNGDPFRLIVPTIEALRDEHVIVVATTGGRPVGDVRVELPTNAHVAEYIPHDLLLPHIDVMVTNGGYGAVQRAVAAGVPLVVAGRTEDELEVAARVAWSGAGINLRTSTPSPAAIRGAVRQVLTDGNYLRRARDLEAAFAQRDGVAEIAALVDEVAGKRRPTTNGRGAPIRSAGRRHLQ